MGKIKSKAIRKSAKKLIEQGFAFSENFEENKKILGNTLLPSKKIRNQLAGLIGQMKKREKLHELNLKKL